MGVTLTDLALLVLAILLPPAAVFLIKEKLDRCGGLFYSSSFVVPLIRAPLAGTS